jgi:ATP-binding protein involved in chromosome partitioning
MSRPLSLKRRNAVTLCSAWSDGFESCILLSDLREACPCAYCSGEQIMGQVVFAGMKTLTPGMNELTALTPVGNYGVQATWKDGHDTGIYSFDMLRSIFEKKRLSQETLSAIDAQLSASENRSS